MKLLYLLEGYLIILIYFIGIDTCKDIKNGVNYGISIKINREDTLELDRIFKQQWTVCHFIYWLIIVFIQIYSKDRYMLVSLVLGPIGNIILLNICHYPIYRKIKILELNESLWKYKRINLYRESIEDVNNDNRFSLKLFVIPLILLICAIILNATLYNIILSIKTLLNSGDSAIANILEVYNNSNIFHQIIMFPTISLIIIIVLGLLANVFIKSNIELGKILIPSSLFMVSIGIVIILEFFNIYSIKGDKPQVLVSLIVISLLMSLPIIKISFGMHIYNLGKKLGYSNACYNENSFIADNENYFKNSLYYNKNNPALMIESRSGLSLQINFANLKVKYLVLIMGISTMCAIGTMISNKVY